METDEKKEIAALKQELKRQRLETKAGIERICYAVNSLRVSLGEKPCSDWLKHSRENFGISFDESGLKEADTVKKEKMEELRRLCLPISDFLKKNCSPHDTVIVTDEQMKMVSDEFCFPFSRYGLSANNPLNADEQSFLFHPLSGRL